MTDRQTNRSERCKGDIALVTGGGSGIGAAIGRWLARQGADVVLGDVDEDGLTDIVDGLDAGAPGTVRGEYMDVTDEASVEAVVEMIDAEYGRLDYLFANAGLAGPVELDVTDYEEWEAVIDVNVNGVFLSSRKTIPLLEASEGCSHIVVTASISGRNPKPIMIPYRTSKAAAIMLTRCLAIALGPAVKVNAICPGRVDTPLVDNLYERRASVRDMTVEELKEREERQPPLGRTPEYDDIIGVLDYLLFQDGFVTGHEFHLDGGDHQAL